MICPKCSGAVPDGSALCNHCGKKLSQTRPARKSKARGNGQGTAYKRGSTWTAQVVVGFRMPSDPGRAPVPVKKTKGGFSKKSEALAYCTVLLAEQEPSNLTLKQLYNRWEPWYSPRIDKETMGCYRAAFAWFKALHQRKVVDISAGDLQECLDDCPRGHRTHQNMKVTAGLLFKYATDCNIVQRNIAENLYIGRGKSVQREPITEDELETIRQAIGKERYAEYVYCLCYLGFRPGEFLSLRKDHYRIIDGIEVLVNGSKTDAGRDRVVIIPPAILDLVRARLFVPGTELLFPQYGFTRKKGLFTGFKQMSDEYFNKHVFKPLTANLGIAEGKVPYSARHTYSDKLKRADGTDKAKAGLMGHTDYAFTKSHYQSTDIDDLLEVAVSLE